jgi:hypothetical protein
MKNCLVSICVPTHNMENGEYFLNRLKESLREQTYSNWELITTINPNTTMAYNTNNAINKASGEIIKILFMDDFFAHKNSLKTIVENYKGGWLVSGCTHTHGKDRFNEHLATWNENIHQVNTIGSPSVLTFENKNPLLFDEKMNWMLDADLYKRLYERYGLPTIIDDINIVIGIGSHQTTNILTQKEKQDEEEYTNKKHAKIT